MYSASAPGRPVIPCSAYVAHWCESPVPQVLAERQPRRAHAVAALVDDDAIADGQVAHRGARLLDDADELVPENLR